MKMGTFCSLVENGPAHCRSIEVQHLYDINTTCFAFLLNDLNSLKGKIKGE